MFSKQAAQPRTALLVVAAKVVSIRIAVLVAYGPEDRSAIGLLGVGSKRIGQYCDIFPRALECPLLVTSGLPWQPACW